MADAAQKPEAETAEAAAPAPAQAPPVVAAAEGETAAPPSSGPALSEQDFVNALKRYSPKHAATHTPDTLDGYRIDLSRPLPELNSSLARAYSVSGAQEEDTALYALVLPMGIPYRYKTIEALKSSQHPNLVKCVAEGEVLLSSSQQVRNVVVLTQPQGIPLSRVIAERGKAFPEQFILRSVLTPLNEILQMLQKHEINHGRINLDSLYLDGSTLTLGECISEPSGCSQHFMFEPMERAMALPMGKGSGDMAGDCYALGVLACLLSIGRDVSSEISAQTYLEELLQQGSYTTLTHKREFSDALQELLRGTLNDNLQERWTPEHISKWLGGKRYNLIPPPSPREATRPVLFAEQEFFSRKALAGALYQHPDTAHQILQDMALPRWAELSLRKPELTEQLEQLVESAEGERPQSPRMAFLLAKTVITLDPSGPLRAGTVSVNVDGLGSLLADAYHNNNQQALRDMALVIENELPGYWSDARQDAPESPQATATLWRLQKMRVYLQHTTPGFGMERYLYDLNASLPCQSELMLPHHVTSVRDLLHALDSMAAEKQASSAPMDRHMAAFLASKLEISKQQRVSELTFDKELSTHPKLVGLKLLALAQEKTGNAPLPGLAYWVALDAFSLLKRIHNRETRQLVMGELKRATKQGRLSQVAFILFNAKIYLSDQAEFARAVRLFEYNRKKILHFQNTKVIRLRAQNIGHKTALILGYTALFITLYSVMQNYLNL